MLNIPTAAQLRRRRARIEDPVPQVSQTVTVTPVPEPEPAPVLPEAPETPPEAPQTAQRQRASLETSRTFLGVPASDWDAEQLRAYVVSKIQEAHGPFPRNGKTEASIFNSFHSRYGKDAGPIAEYAFDVGGGFWKGAPIGVNRFCKNSDQYFADPIRARLRQ